jgi:predicted metalloprotease with PDZ domain
MHGVPAPDEAMQAQICRQWEAMAKVQIQTLGQFPQDEFHFILVGLPYAFYHGVEHRRCTVLALGPASEIWTHLYRELLGVASHELFHAWNVKSFRPKGMESYRYEGWMYSDLGYVYEGFTTYYGDLFLVRSGCLLPDEYLEEVNAYLLRHSENYGRYNHGLRESSIDTWVDGYSQSQSAPHRRVSIYAEGMLQALHLDLVIRSSTMNNESPASLDDLIRYLWKRFEQSPETPGYTQETLTLWLQENVSVPSTYKNWGDYFRIHYEQPNSIEESLRSILPQFGCRLTTTPNEDRIKHLLGLQMKWNQAEPRVEHCVPGSPAALAGLGPDDRWLSWEIQSDSSEQSPAVLNPSSDADFLRKALTPADSLRVRWITALGHERQGVLRTHSTLRYYHHHKIELDLQAGPNELRARKQWLGIA